MKPSQEAVDNLLNAIAVNLPTKSDTMKLSQEAVDRLLNIIADFDRERGIPHDYLDLEHVLQKIEIEFRDDRLHIVSPRQKNK